MPVSLVQVDAFATPEPFSGNPAAVVVLTQDRDDRWLQGVANEMNLSETAFVWPREDGDWTLRWFTPTKEVDLCGHATLAAAHVLWSEGHASGPLTLHTRSGPLRAYQDSEGVTIDLPASPLHSLTDEDIPAGFFASLGVWGPVWKTAFDYLVLVESEGAVAAAAPSLTALGGIPSRGFIITAPGRSVDFVSRFFAPSYGVPEDPVTGSAHCALAPFWAERLGKTTLRAQQLSARGGALSLALVQDGTRVELSGRTVTTLRGSLLV